MYKSAMRSGSGQAATMLNRTSIARPQKIKKQLKKSTLRILRTTNHKLQTVNYYFVVFGWNVLHECQNS